MPCAALQASTDFERQLLRQSEALDQAQGFLRKLEQQKVADLESSMQRCASAHAGYVGRQAFWQWLCCLCSATDGQTSMRTRPMKVAPDRQPWATNVITDACPVQPAGMSFLGLASAASKHPSEGRLNQ